MVSRRACIYISGNDCKFWISLCRRGSTLPRVYHSGNYVCAYFFYPESSIKGKNKLKIAIENENEKILIVGTRTSSV